MVSVLDLQSRVDTVDEPAPAQTPEPTANPQEFEFVLGRRQVASLLFVASVILMICIAAAYMTGKAMSPKPSSPVPEASVIPREADPPPIVLNQEAVPEPPLFAEPKAGSVYIQMGAVEK